MLHIPSTFHREVFKIQTTLKSAHQTHHIQTFSFFYSTAFFPVQESFRYNLSTLRGTPKVHLRLLSDGRDAAYDHRQRDTVVVIDLFRHIPQVKFPGGLFTPLSTLGGVHVALKDVSFPLCKVGLGRDLATTPKGAASHCHADEPFIAPKSGKPFELALAGRGEGEGDMTELGKPAGQLAGE
ncbi:MAG: hypothetical protein HZA04_02765 [Nitrospinae bacterium]|nr:hypothetical protein [Nitrospinota bacterium]